jgi:hypothetical protein
MSLELQKSRTVKIKAVVKEYEGKKGVDIREYVESEKYTGATKKGLWILIELFPAFKQMVNEIQVG